MVSGVNCFENGVAICSFQKDYELQSWNEQGEITKIEGMLTVAFSFIFSCSHRDNKKQLYLIMKIPYTVNMQVAGKQSKKHNPYENRPLTPRYDDSIRLRDELNKAYKRIEELEYKISLIDKTLLTLGFNSDELKKALMSALERKDEEIQLLKKEMGETSKLNDKIQHLTDYVKQLETIISKKNEEVSTFEKHNAFMSELLDERNSGWLLRRDLAKRTNPVPDEPNEFGYPLNFKEEKVHNLHSNEEKSTWCHFKYYLQDDFPDGKFDEYDMPWSLYEFLSGRLQVDTKIKKEIKKTPKKSGLVKFDSSESLLKYFKETLGDKFYSYTLIDIFASFIFENIKKPIDLENARRYCEIKRGKKPVPATIHKHLNLLIEYKIIYRKHKGIYEVNEQSINFD